jgi:hypothetical protein
MFQFLMVLVDGNGMFPLLVEVDLQRLLVLLFKKKVQQLELLLELH